MNPTSTLNQTDPEHLNNTDISSTKNKIILKSFIAGIIIGGLLVAVTAVAIGIILFHKHKKSKSVENQFELDEIKKKEAVRVAPKHVANSVDL